MHPHRRASTGSKIGIVAVGLLTATTALAVHAAPATAAVDDFEFADPVIQPWPGIGSAASGSFGGGRASDLLVVDGGRRATVLLGDGAGGFDIVTGPRVHGRTQVLAAELDGDRRDDLIMLNSSRLIVCRAKGGPRFGDCSKYEARGPLLPAVADLDADGDADLILPTVDGTVIYANDGSGGLEPAARIRGPRAEEVGAADINLDAIADIVLVRGNNDLQLMVGLGDLTYGEGVPLKRPGPWVHDVEVADVDADGAPDLTVLTPYEVAVRLGDGTGLFGKWMRKPFSGLGGFELDLADLDRDGLLDVVTSEDDAVVVLPGRGGGHFANTIAIDAGLGGSSLFSVDVDRDGWTDVIAVDQYESEVIATLINLGDESPGVGPRAGVLNP